MANIRTISTKPIRGKDIIRKWHLFDIGQKVLGRTATEIARILQGKHKPTYSSHLDSGDYVVVVNAKDVRLTGKKAQVKTYTRYSGYPGGLTQVHVSQLLREKPEEVVRHAVSGMLPKNKLRDRRLARLFIFKDTKHPYEDKLK